MKNNIPFIVIIIASLVLLSCRGGAINNRTDEYTIIPIQVNLGNQNFQVAVGSSSYTHGNGMIAANRTCAEGRHFRLYSSRILPMNQTSTIEFTAYRVVNCPARQFTAQNDYFNNFIYQNDGIITFKVYQDYFTDSFLPNYQDPFVHGISNENYVKNIIIKHNNQYYLAISGTLTMKRTSYNQEEFEYDFNGRVSPNFQLQQTVNTNARNLQRAIITTFSGTCKTDYRH